MSDTLRVAVRRFGPFESAIRKQWADFCAVTGCALHLDAVAFSPVLHLDAIRRPGV